MKRKGYCFLILSVVFATFGLRAASAQSEEKEIVKELIASLKLGEPVYYENITVIPVYTLTIVDRTPYVTLEQALKRGWLEIKEVGGGNVPQLEITNKSNKTIYVMGGEILSGGKQDRIVCRDLLIRPGKKNVQVPVYCVESGRWHHTSSNFYSKYNLGTHKLRAAAQDAAVEAQSRIWNHVEKTNQKMGLKSKTEAYQEVYENKDIQAQIKSIKRAMQDVTRLYENTIGVIVGVGNSIVSLDIFINPHLFNSMWSKILKSSVLSAVSSDEPGSIAKQDAADFLKLLCGKKYRQKPAIDLGLELIVVDDEVSVNILTYRNEVLHLAGFPHVKEKIGFGVNDGEQGIQAAVTESLRLSGGWLQGITTACRPDLGQ